MNRDGASLDAQAEPDIRAGRSIGPPKEELVSASDRSEHPPGAIRRVHDTERIIAVCIEGDFDRTNVSDLDAQIDLALQSGNDLILDMSEATFIDSSVIQSVVRAAQSAERTRQAIVLQLGTAAIVERVLEIVKIEEVLPRAHDRQEALRVIQQQVRV